jgi:hypothetical protein
MIRYGMTFEKERNMREVLTTNWQHNSTFNQPSAEALSCGFGDE